ncbi:unnamed protein product [Larinioides sclopetarius]|uniref:Photosystem II protein I n=1 Tax=Larinioides sclopetarius TaxID=280406 RepID=A0AAV2BR14_9ARAC
MEMKNHSLVLSVKRKFLGNVIYIDIVLLIQKKNLILVKSVSHNFLSNKV